MNAHKKKNKILQELDQDLWIGLENLCRDENLEYLLLLFEDQVMWGMMREGKFCIDPQVDKEPAPLGSSKLLQAHCFNKQCELRIWRNGEKFDLCWLCEEEESEPAHIVQEYILWGNGKRQLEDGFQCYVEGQRGFVQNLPLQGKGNVRCALEVVHRFGEDGEKQRYIKNSRIRDLKIWEVNDVAKA